ncbi:MAG: glycosyltransferase family 4 protein [Chloroflexi bacterium]|nr:glycosyltransferase family 4 protein [Chloroflexota bacterium]
MRERADVLDQLTGRTLVIDVRNCQLYPERGIARYVQQLALHMARIAPGLHLRFLYAAGWGRPIHHAELRSIGRISIYPQVPAPVDAYLIGNFGLPSMDSERDPAHHLVPDSIRTLQPALLGILHDFIPGLFAETYLFDENLRSDWAARLQIARECDHLFANSATTCRDGIERFGLQRERITTIFGAIDTAFWLHALATDPIPVDRPSLSGGQYYLYVGGDDWRKNVEGLLRAYALARQRPGVQPLPALVIVGGLQPDSRARLDSLAASFQLRPGVDVVLTGNVSDLELRGLVSNALASVFPSLYEGLGMPILESYARGRAVFGSNTSAVAEVIAPECRFDSWSIDAMADMLVRIPAEPALHVTSLQFGEQVLAGMSWAASAERLLRTLARVLGAHTASPHT